MAIKYVQSSGNWSTVQWYTAASGGSTTTTPGAGDTAEANGFTVTINTSITCTVIQNTAGGSYTVLNGPFTLTCNITNTSTTAILSINYVGTTTIVGNLTASTGACCSLPISGLATINITGNITGGSGTNCYGMSCLTNSSTNIITLNVTGNVTAGSGSSSHGILASSINDPFLITVNGSVFGGTGSSGSVGINNQCQQLCTINGSVFGGSSSGANHGVQTQSSGGLTISGNVVGGTGSGASHGVNATGSGTIAITGSCTGGTSTAASVGLNLSSTSPATVSGGAIGGASGNLGNVGIYASGSGTIVVQTNLTYGVAGIAPTYGKVFFNYTTSSTITVVNSSAASAIFVHPSATVTPPANGDVRLGTIFNAGNNTGTLAVPNPNSVAYGVSTDNTTGTAVLLMSAIPSSPITGSLGAAIANAATLTFDGSSNVKANTEVNSDKTGYTLSSTGLDSIAITPPSGAPTTFTQYMVMLYRRFFKKSTSNGTTISTYANDNITIITSQTLSDDGITETQGSA